MSFGYRALALVVLFALAGVATLLLGPQGGPIGRERVSRFADRHALAITPDNGPQVVRALGTTHRWRRFGLVSGLLLAALWALQEGRLSLDLVATFAGWFAGAVLAEWRISAPPSRGTRRQADLRVRTVSSFVTASNRVALATVAALLVVTAVWAGVVDLADPGRRADWLAAVAACLLSGGVLWAVTRRIVDRPRPAGPPDIRDADDALRGHSLTVLAGSAVALASLPLAGFVGTILDRLAGPGPGALAWFLTLVAGLLWGWLVAARSPSVRRSAEGGTS